MAKTYTKLPADTDTHEQFDAIAKAKDWSLTTTVRKAAEALAERERLQFPIDAPRRRRRKSA